MVNSKKILAMFLVFTMTFSNFAFVTKSFATTAYVSLFGGNSSNDENVKFEAFLADDENVSNALATDVNNENVSIKLKLDIQNGGYLKNGKIEMKAKDDGELNFEVEEENDIAKIDNVQSLEDNVLALNKIDNADDEMEIDIPIKYHAEEYINESKLCNTAKVILSGIYIDSKGKENEISKEVELTLAWKDERAVKVETEVSKYIQFGNGGVILQTIVKVDNTNEDKNSLPVKETELNIDIPTIDGKTPSEVSIVANSTEGTNGKGVGEVQFDNNNWEYNQEENKIKITVQNQKELVEVNHSDSYLKVENEEIKKEERYYSKAGVDEFLLTYTFQNIEMADEMNATSKVEAKVSILNGVEADDNVSVVTAEKEENFVLTGQTGNIVSYDVENKTNEISKSYAYLNKEIETESKTAINISYTDIVEEVTVEDLQNFYIDKSGNNVEADDIYYKEVSINKAEMVNILGEDGTIEILDASGNTLTTITKETSEDENGNYMINFQDRISKIAVKLSAPVNTGNLVISSKKAVSGSSLTKADYANMEYIATTTVQKAKFDYVSEIVELGNCMVKTKLNDTKTNINLIVDRESLSTITPNSNVEMRLELNNDEETSDIYGNSVFEIEMPEYITSLNLSNASMIYGEGLDISNVETYVRDGKIIIKVTVNGKQTDYNSGVLTNGANIVLNADITVDMYTPSVDTMIKAYCYNSEATNYDNPVEYTINDATVCDYKEAEIEYSAPNGLVAINTLSNYNEVGTSLTSVKQGEKVDYIDIYSQEKNVTMEVVVVNNNDNSVSDLSILGRIPFKGVKDLSTGKDLGTTLDTKLVSGIASNESNNAEFTVYYSENGEATKDLNDSSNGWVQNPENLENMKSYLIVPVSSDYKMEAKQVLKFTYEYQIPENLEHNEDIYGTFLAYYTNNSEVATTDETSKPDLVGLTTGEGPELELDVKTNTAEVKALEELKITATVKNTGADVASGVVVNIPVPSNTTFVSAEADKDTIETTLADGKVVANVGQLAKDGTVEITVKVTVNDTTEYESDKIEVLATASAKDLQKELTKKAEDVNVKKSEFIIKQYMDYDYPDMVFSKNDERELYFIIYVKNMTDNVKNNVVVETQLPKELKYQSGTISGEEENVIYDEATHKITWKIGTLNSKDNRGMNLILKVGDLDTGITYKEAEIATKISADETETYDAQNIVVKIGKANVSVVQTTTTPTYVKEGETIQYTFSLTNDGLSHAQDILLTDIIPDGLVIREVSYSVEGEEIINRMSETESAELEVTVPENSTLDVNVKAIASNLDGAQEKTVTNEGTISSEGTETVKSNSVTHIIQANENNLANSSDDDDNNDDSVTTSETNNNTDITKSYKITGTAWLDANENGMRDNGEKIMSDVTAMLVDSSSGVIKSTVTTNSNGEYAFSGIQNGSYLVLFKYDTVLYTTTTYKKEGVETSVNSDVVTTKIEQDGRKENGAVTDVISINGASVSNIDIGLVEAEQFSLELDKAISKVTVQNSQGTVTEEFDKTKLAKYDIAAKYLSGTTVYVEYILTVTNNGDLSGFASEIVDYIPQGMTFNSNLNPDWYTGTDGNLYTKALADSELAKGESKEIKLVLTKQMTAENTGIVSNTAEIADDYNIYGVSDKNSKPANKAQGEDDMSTADTILTVKTGESLIYVSAIIISSMVGCAVGFVVYERVIKPKRNGGV